MIYPICRKAFAIGFFLLMLLPSLANADVGHFLFVYGKVSVTAINGEVQQATKGMQVQEGDTISSGLSGAAQLRMKDGAFLAIRPNTVLRIDVYAYKEKGRKQQSIISLLKGTFRAISGKIGQHHPKDDLVKTPVATIGIRGTDHEPAYIPPPLAGQVATVPPGAYDKVNKGATFMQTDVGRVNLGPDQVGHVAALNEVPVILPVMPAFYQTPNKPVVQKKKDEEGGKKDNGKKPSAEKGGDKGGKGKAGIGEKGKSGNNKTDNSYDGKDKVNSDKAVKEKGRNTQGGSSQNHSDNVGAGGENVAKTLGGNSNVVDTTPSVVQTTKATDDTDDATINLTDQTKTTSSGTVSNIGTTTTTPATITTAVLTPKKSAGVSYYVGNQSSPFSRTFTIEGSSGDTFTTNSAGSLTSWAFQLGAGALASQIKTGTVNGISGTPQVVQAPSFSTTGIKYGSYVGTSVSLGLISGSTATDTLSPRFFHWITGPGISTPYLTQAYRGTTNFAFEGGIFHTETGALPSAYVTNITVDFNTLKLSLTVNATVSTGLWSASATNVPLDGNSFFVQNQSQPSALNVFYTPTTSGSQTTGFGNVDGTFTGKLTGLIMNISLGVTGGQSLTGVAAFVNNDGAVSSAINHQFIAFASLDPRTNFAHVDYTPTLTNGFFNVPSIDVTKNTAGGITKFLTSVPNYSTVNSVDNTTYVPTYLSTTGTVTNTGNDSVSGISWGRWTGGGITSTRLGGSAISFQPTNLHYIAGPATSQQVQLPVTGIYNYTLAGNTNPTDQLGTVGVLNSATLKANFTSMKVDVGINATVGATTLAATATGMPIDATASFSMGSATAASVTCSGTCGSVNTGDLGGGFTGSTGNGAGITYSLRNAANATTVGTVISGVAAFHR